MLQNVALSRLPPSSPLLILISHLFSIAPYPPLPAPSTAPTAPKHPPCSQPHRKVFECLLRYCESPPCFSLNACFHDTPMEPLIWLPSCWTVVPPSLRPCTQHTELSTSQHKQRHEKPRNPHPKNCVIAFLYLALIGEVNRGKKRKQTDSYIGCQLEWPASL